MIKFLKKIFLVGIISLGIINFSNAGSYTYTGSFKYNINSTTSTSDLYFSLYTNIPLINHNIGTISNYISNMVVNISNFTGCTSVDFKKVQSLFYFYYYSSSNTSYVGSNSANPSYSLNFSSFLNNLDGSYNFDVSNFNVSTYYGVPGQVYFRFYYGTPITNPCSLSFDYSITFSGDKIIDQSSLGGGTCDYSDYELKSDITENYCTNKFSNLIDEDDITSSYCELEFGLIDPENCPVSGGTGDINWSNFFVNSEQIQGASMVYLRLPEFLNWDYTYINSGSTLNINVENAGDSEYIQSILDIQNYHPDKDQFAFSFAGFLTLLMPYIIITLFVLFIWRLIRRIFK